MELTLEEYSEIIPNIDGNWFAFTDQSLEDFQERLALARAIRKIAKRLKNEELIDILNWGISEMVDELRIRQEAPEACQTCPGLMMSWVKDNPNCGGCDPAVFECEFNKEED